MFADRNEAGVRLAQVLAVSRYKRAIVLALPRGGVPVGFEIAKALNIPLDTIVSRKIGAPFNPEYAVGAIAPHGTLYIDDDSIRYARISRGAVEGVAHKEEKEMRRRIDKYKSGAYAAGYIPKTVIVVDDGIATGLTARAALTAVHTRYPKALVVLATPICSGEAARSLKAFADEVVCLEKPESMRAISQAFERFEQLTDEEVIKYLEAGKRR